MHYQDLITIDSDILGGVPVFKNTRVPVESLFDHLLEGISLEGFLEDFPSVSKEQAQSILQLSSKIFASPGILNQLLSGINTANQAMLSPEQVERVLREDNDLLRKLAQ